MIPILYKEWLKLRPSWLLILLANTGFCLYLFLQVRHEFRVEHAEMLFYQASRVGKLFYEDIRTVPLLTGLAIAVAQWAPEMTKGRLRLALHLPMGTDRMILAHLAIGLATLGLVLAMDMAALVVTVATYFPSEFAGSAATTALPWFLAGVAAYLGATLVLLEPVRRYQATNLLIGLGGAVWLCLEPTGYGGFDHALWGLVLILGLLVPACLLPARRFRSGGR